MVCCGSKTGNQQSLILLLIMIFRSLYRLCCPPSSRPPTESSFLPQLLALPASGEKIIFPLLDPMLHAYRPVLETLKGGGGGASESATASATSSSHSGGGRVQRGEGARRSAVEEEGRGISCPVSIIYGSPDHDWMPHRWVGSILCKYSVLAGGGNCSCGCCGHC